VRRIASVIRLRAEHAEEYRARHATVWPDGEWWAPAHELFHLD
jgi:L-rhamnose mutarotase